MNLVDPTGLGFCFGYHVFAIYGFYNADGNFEEEYRVYLGFRSLRCWGDEGNPPQGTGPEKPANDPCPPEKKRFFNWLDAQLGKMASDLSTQKTVLLTLAAKEGGWTKEDLDHNMPLNNPFGVQLIRNGKAVGNIDYTPRGGLDAAINHWKTLYADRVRGAKTAEDFVKGLQHPEKGDPYNTATPSWEKDFHRIDMAKWMKNCGIKP